jgi:phosphatidylglycerol:prolipoprotein diacylglycerol transferase
MLYLGVLGGVVAGNVAAHAAGIDPFRMFVATLVLVVPALIGGRLAFVATHWHVYRHDLSRIWDRTDGGAAQDGAIVVVLPLTIPVFAALRLSGAAWDVAVFTLLVIAIFARVGCLLNGCCAGRPSGAWLCVSLPDHRGRWERRLPSQCLEGAWAGGLLIIAATIWRWLPFPGALFLLLSAVYAAGRLVLMTTREAERDGSRRTFQYAVILSMIACSILVLAARWPTRELGGH